MLNVIGLPFVVDAGVNEGRAAGISQRARENVLICRALNRAKSDA
jgi:hypothetical protein